MKISRITVCNIHVYMFQAFGVGALEEDDDDIFTHESIASYHNSLTLPTDKEQTNKYGWTGGKEMGGKYNIIGLPLLYSNLSDYIQLYIFLACTCIDILSGIHLTKDIV